MSKIKKITIYEYGNKTYRTARGLRERIANDIAFKLMHRKPDEELHILSESNYKILCATANRRLGKSIHE